MSDKKCYSINNEDFNYDEIEEAITDKLSGLRNTVWKVNK